MKCSIPEISWHHREPVLSVDFQHDSKSNVYRVASGGADSHVLIWHVTPNEDGKVSIEVMCDLTRHIKAVNVVRFSPSGELLASGDDEGSVCLWQKSEMIENYIDDDKEIPSKENWQILRLIRLHFEDLYDLCWSPDSKYLLSGCVDNTAKMVDVSKAKELVTLNEHKGFVQGVAWDPLDQYLATIATDRDLRIYNRFTRRIKVRVSRCSPFTATTKAENPNKKVRLFQDDTLQTYCRRLSFSPDGNILLVPTGILDESSVGGADSSAKRPTPIHATFVFVRQNWSVPVVYLPSFNKPSLVTRFSPVTYELRKPSSEPESKPQSLFQLPYRMVFAVATSDSVLLYDTQQLAPFGRIVDIHFTRLTDLAWSNDGRILMVSSTDGYCSFITFEKGEIGVVYGGELSLAPKLFDARNSEAQSKKRNRKKKSVENKENTTAEEENRTAKEEQDVAKPDAHDSKEPPNVTPMEVD